MVDGAGMAGEAAVSEGCGDDTYLWTAGPDAPAEDLPRGLVLHSGVILGFPSNSMRVVVVFLRLADAAVLGEALDPTTWPVHNRPVSRVEDVEDSSNPERANLHVSWANMPRYQGAKPDS